MARILYVITKGNWGGAQRYVYDLAIAAKGAGHEVMVACGETGVLVEKISEAGIQTVALAGLSRDIGFFDEFRAFFGLLALYRHERPDIVHVNSSKAGGLGCLVARLACVPRILFTAHGWAFNEARPWWQKILIYKLVWLTVLLSHTTICVSEAMCRDIRWMPFVRKKCIVIYNGILCGKLLSREEARAKLAPPIVAKYWIGMISELHPTKRVDDAIRAMGTVVKRHPETLLVVLGEGNERYALEHLIRDLHLERHVFLAGFRDNAPGLLKAFDLFVHASLSESLGYAILEAGCASLPVVVTNVGGIPEIVPDDAHGFLVPPRNSEALARAIETLMSDSRLSAELGARLHARVLQKFSKQQMISETLRLYENR